MVANAQGFRILVTLANSRAGLKLTAATLGAFTKYPTASTGRKKPGYIGQKKHGFFNAERRQFEEVTSELGLTQLGNGFWQRHPLAFLVEAADDICYRVIDVEDGVKVGRIAYKEAEQCLVEMLPASAKYDPNAGDQDTNLGWLRATAIGNLIEVAQQVFLDHEDEIVVGKFSAGLIDASPLAKAIHQAKGLVEERVFKWDRTIRAEISGSKMLHGLLDDLLSAAAHPNTSFARKLLAIIPGYPHHGGAYDRLLAITDFISGMTDSYLVETYQQIRGGVVP